MIRPPFMARVAAGMAVTAYEETLKLPSTAVSLPMTTVSQILQTTMRFQQVLTSLAIKGDHLFESLGARPEENPEWAVFDESAPSDTNTGTGAGTGTNGEGSATPGRFALYSTPPPVADDEPAPSAAEKPASEAAAPAPKKRTAKKAAGKSAAAKSTATKTAATKTADVPEIVEYLDYDSLTLAQLRARLRTLSAEDLTALLDYETAHAARAPFMTMLSNRVTTVRDK
jgi:hypothetical protein